MTGVEILLEMEVLTATTCNWWLSGFVWCVFVIIGGIIGFVCADFLSKGTGVLLGCLIGALIGVVAWYIAVGVTTKPISYETRYKVTIDDSVSMNEFLDKYEILDQEGKIYTVKEKE